MSEQTTPTPEPMSDEQIARWRTTANLDARAGAPVGNALREAADEVERLNSAVRGGLSHVGAVLAERDEARAALAEERARHGELVAEMQRARQTADEARAEQIRLAEQVRVLAGLLRRGNPKVICSKHPNHAEPGCEVCRDAGIFRSALGEQDGDQTDG